MRTRFLLPALTVVILTLGLVAAGCGSAETGASSGTETPGTGGPGWVTVDVQTASDALSADEGAQIVDVREPDEWAETGVPQGAVLIPLGDLESRAAAELTADKPVYVICRSGNRSQTGSDILVGQGFTDVYNVDGGINAWIAAGLPVEPYTP